jgi:charged multivesicular body protein 2A
MKTHHDMATAMQGVGKAMANMNQAMNLPAMQKIMRDFERENEKMDITQETMEDAMDGVMGDADDSDEEDLIVNQVLDEIGINVGQQMEAAPTGAPAAAEPAAAAEEKDAGVAELEARLNNLRR